MPIERMLIFAILKAILICFASGYHSIALLHGRAAPALFIAEQRPTINRHCDVVQKASSSAALEQSPQSSDPCHRCELL